MWWVSVEAEFTLAEVPFLSASCREHLAKECSQRLPARTATRKAAAPQRGGDISTFDALSRIGCPVVALETQTKISYVSESAQTR
eukprot:CAMPEP_0183546480 /NCGR_PEP_ID=MMETSP0371-20130417/54041_1 /TAXON_ID=268820 /ORGANISM="Peridinium aciculiferum, Strain PAER-2" /LENGTH=84 /DNA_ID=CAMNT_0025749063 /DNA_START=31 /DNA_END=281 /DNA_ORIENTATION=-